MAFIRSYAAQGDPLPRSRSIAGELIRSPFPPIERGSVVGMVNLATGRPKRGAHIPMLSHPIGFRRGPAFRGDPFLGKLFKKAGKALKKVTLKGVVKGVSNVARIAAPFIPGVGGVVAGLIPPPRQSVPQVEPPVTVSPEQLEPQVAPAAAASTMTQADFDDLVDQLVAQMIERMQIEAARARF